jgi:hypothetical protein
MAVPVGDGDGAEDDVPARIRVVELAPQPVRRHQGVGIGRGQPDRGRIGAGCQPQQFPHSRGPSGAHPASADTDHPGPGRAGHRGRLVGARVGDDHNVDRQAKRTGSIPQRGQAGRQQRLLVMRRHDHADRLDRAEPVAHTRPIAWATDAGVPSVRM